MAVQPIGLSVAESYLIAMIEDSAGIDLAEFMWEDQMASNEEKIFRCWDFQYAWWRNSFVAGKPLYEQPTQVIDACGRAVGKTASIILRAWAFPIQHPGAEMVITAPELIHLDPLTSRIEDRIKETRITRELLPKRVGLGFKHRPFHVNFLNGSKILGRIPQRDGRGMKGLHPLKLELDEGQDFPAPGWTEVIETLRHGEKGAQWRAHGVSRGVRDEFYRHSQPDSGWVVHTITGMHRPTWNREERDSKIEAYGTRDSPDYKRNILGQHGDATNPLFVLFRLMATVDDQPGSEYNQDIYYYRRITDEMLRAQPMEMLLLPPGSHKAWRNTWAGMDIGLTNAPTEILVFGEEVVKGKADVVLRLLSRIHLERISSPDQRRVVDLLFQHYDLRLLTLDRGGLGLPVYQEIQRASPKLVARVRGYNADEKVVVGYDPHEDWQDAEEFEIKRPAKEFGYDKLRDYVDLKKIILPWDRELLGEWQGQTWVPDRSETNPYGKKIFARGKFHTLDAAAMMVVGKELMLIEQLQKVTAASEFIPLSFA